MKKTLLLPLFSVLVLFLCVAGATFAQSSTGSVRTKVGNPKGADGSWPTTGTLTQGPKGAFDHGPLNLNALDIASPASPPVYSVFDGTVTAVHDCAADGDCSRGWGGYGNSVQIQGADGGVALYGHLSAIEVSAGQSVAKGDEIGIMGTTGVSTGIHLHFELRGIPLAPPYIPIEVVPPNCDLPSIPCSPYSI